MTGAGFPYCDSCDTHDCEHANPARIIARLRYELAERSIEFESLSQNFIADQNTLAEFGREVERLRSQAAEREALLARGAELIEQDLKEIDGLRAELWKFNRPHGYDVNGRTYSDTFGLCSHGVILIRECPQCNAGSGRPRPITEEKTE